MLNCRDEVPCQDYPKSLHAVTLWPIPLDDKLSKVQQEDISSVETLPGHLHLEGTQGSPEPIESLHIGSISSLPPFPQPCSVPSQDPSWAHPPLQPSHSSCP